MAQTSPGKRSLLDVTNQQQTPLPFDDSMSGKWIDDTKYIYVQTTGGLSTVGTWLYDRGDNSNKHLSSFSVDFSRMVMLPERKQIWAVSQQSGINLIRMNLDGSPSQNLGPCPLMIPQRMPPADDSVDLGFNGSGAADLWKPVAVDEAALAATQPAEPPEGKLKLFELTKDFSADDKTFVEQAYDYCQTNAMLSNYCDPTKVAMKVFQLHQSQPGQPVTNFYVSTDFSDTADHDHLVRYGHDHALALIAMDQKLTADQKRQIADRTGSLLADAYFKEAKPNLRNIDSLCQTAMANARQGVESGASPAAEQTTSPPIQQQQQQQQQMQQTQQQPASHIDQAASEAKKAKDAANRLKGLFGHN
jgi:hypothetical protein